MKIVVLGASGMLGHVAVIYLREKYGARVLASSRMNTGIDVIDRDLHLVDLFRPGDLKAFLEKARPCVVVNCAAVNDGRRDPAELRAINTELPHAIAGLLDAFGDGSRLIHVSTDGVFDGGRGQYTEGDIPDARDPYGASKAEGEVIRPDHLTIRTSIIGLDPVHSRGLVQWFLSQSGEVKGYSQVFWSGVTTLELTRFIDQAIALKVTGLYHLSGECISKFDLLRELNALFAKGCLLIPDGQTRLNRCLATQRRDIAYAVPQVARMLEEWKLWIKHHSLIYRSAYPLQEFWEGSK